MASSPSSPPPPSSSPSRADLDIAQVEREMELDAHPDLVWQALTDPDELRHWLAADVDVEIRPGAVGRIVEDDGTVRHVLVTNVGAASGDGGVGRISWHWWVEGDPGDGSTGELTSVDITVEPVEPVEPVDGPDGSGAGDRTLVRIVETLASATPGDGIGSGMWASAAVRSFDARSSSGSRDLLGSVSGRASLFVRA